MKLSAVLCRPLDERPLGRLVNGYWGNGELSLCLSVKLHPVSGGVHSLKSLMVSRLTEEFQDEGFYGLSCYKLFGSLDHWSDLMIKVRTPEVCGRFLGIPVGTVCPSMLWGCPSVPALGAWGRGGVPPASRRWNFSVLVSTRVRVNQVNVIAAERGTLAEA